MARRTLIVLFLLVSMLPASAQVVVQFGDPVVESRIRFIIGQPEGDIQDTDLVGIGFTELTISGFGVGDLSGLEYCLDLEVIDLSANFISDLSPLAALSELTSLILEDNAITGLLPLAGLPRLATLNLAENEIVDIAPLAEVPTLRRLDLRDNAVVSIEALAGLPRLTEVSLENNAITDISPLAENERLSNGDTINLLGNPLNQDSLCSVIPVLLDRGAQVEFEGVCPGAVEGIVTDLSTGLRVDCAIIVAQAPLVSPAIGAADLDGAYYMNDLAPVIYAFQVFAPGYERAARLGSVDPFETGVLNFALEPVVRDDVVSVAGTVRDSNQTLPLIGAQVTALDGAVIVDTTYTCATGAYELLLPAGGPASLTIAFAAPGHAGRELDLNLADTRVVNVVLTPRSVFGGGILGAVINARTGEGLEDARIIVQPVGGILGVGAMTAADGTYAVENLAAGEYLLRVSSRTHAGDGETRTVNVAGEIVVEDFSLGTPIVFPPPSCGAAAIGAARSPWNSFAGDVLIFAVAAFMLSAVRRSRSA